MKKPTPPESSRLAQLGDLLAAMVAVVLTGNYDLGQKEYSVRSPMTEEQTFALGARSHSFMPLREQFADVLSNRWFGKFVYPAIVDDGQSPYFDGPPRFRILAYLGSMPSVLRQACNKALGADADYRLIQNARGDAYRISRDIASEFGEERAHVVYCWKSKADLDEKWRALRAVLQDLRSNARGTR